MAMQQNPGFLAAMGLNVDKEAILKSQRQAQQADALGLAESMGFQTPYEQGAANIGALLGARLAKPEGLTQDQERRANAAAAANARMEEWMRQNSKAPMADREDKFMEFVAEEAFRNGLADVGAQAAGAVDERRKLRELQKVEMELAGLKVPQAKANLTQTQASTEISRGTGRYKPIWQFGSTDPNASKYAWIDPATGDALAGPGGQVIAKVGQYTDIAPTRPDAFGRGGKGAGFAATPTEMGGVRDAHAALYRRGETLNSMRDVLEESIDTSGTLAATGNAGKLVSFVNRWSHDLFNVMQVAGLGGDFTAVGKDGDPYSIDTTEGRRKFTQQYAAIIDKYLPEEFRKTSNQAERWRALVTELLYLEARATEPGSKQFSDADIERQASIVGAHLNDPKSISDIILNSYDRAYNDLEYRMSMYPEAVRSYIVTPEARDSLAEQRRNTRERWSEPLIETREPPKKNPNDARRETAKRLGIEFVPGPEDEVIKPADQPSPFVAGSRGPQRRR